MSALIEGRLPGGVRPELYQIRMNVAPEERRFGGEVAIDLQIAQPTNTITLHALDLDIPEATVGREGSAAPARVATDPASETLTLTFAEPLPAGPARLTLRFSGKLNRHLRGLYEAHAGGETYAFTQFEATDARRMIPSFDEPGMKARFRLTVTIPAHLTALSNMPVISEKTEGALKTVSFEETPVMSTYLLALAVARLESKEIDVAGTRVAIWTVPGQLHLGDFALKVTSAVLPLLNDYFDLPYPYPKLDLVSVPDFAMGAMENWGAIFFRDSRLLLDETLASTGTQRGVANVITHEIVHQWFGNLVTMAWWDDLWLNEAFATWLAVKIVDQWRPEWHSWIEFQQEKQIPLGVDALQSSRPIQAKVTNAAQIEEMFDALTYEKGAACLRMIEHFLGEEAFRKGIRDYMKAHQYKNTVAGDLWSTLEAASGQPVAAIAKDWFTQPGFPLVTIEASESNFRNLTIEQRRFFAGGHTVGGGASPTWSVPFTLKYEDDGGVQKHRVLLKNRVTTVSLPGSGAVRWVYGNAEESGFLRVDYNRPLRAALQPVIPAGLSAPERIGSLNHLWALAVSGDLSIVAFMETLARFKGDSTRVVVEAAAGYFETLSNQMIPAKDRSKFQAFAKDFFEPVWKEIGWEAAPGEDDERRLTRAAALWAMGAIAQDEDVISELPRRWTRFQAKATSIDPTLATPLVRLTARTDGGSAFDRFVQKFKTAPTPEERDRYLLALADFTKPDLARKLLEFALSDEVRSQDVWKPVRYLLGNPATQEESWRFVQAEWRRLREKGGSIGAMRIIQGARALWREPWYREVQTFFNDPANKIAAAERALAQTLEFMQIGIRFKERQMIPLSRWMQDRGGSAKPLIRQF
ncbi:MAG: ERAP1-like C-terminal domain-containing protein [Nitrospirae bacterium]|nr:ERAP1-like C-terminal domain-containing protein [Candidatus Manganitrophaceae bacterium]